MHEKGENVGKNSRFGIFNNSIGISIEAQISRVKCLFYTVASAAWRHATPVNDQVDRTLYIVYTSYIDIVRI